MLQGGNMIYIFGPRVNKISLETLDRELGFGFCRFALPNLSSNLSPKKSSPKPIRNSFHVADSVVRVFKVQYYPTDRICKSFSTEIWINASCILYLQVKINPNLRQKFFLFQKLVVKFFIDSEDSAFQIRRWRWGCRWCRRRLFPRWRRDGRIRILAVEDALEDVEGAHPFLQVEVVEMMREFAESAPNDAIDAGRTPQTEDLDEFHAKRLRR